MSVCEVFSSLGEGCVRLDNFSFSFRDVLKSCLRKGKL